MRKSVVMLAIVILRNCISKMLLSVVIYRSATKEVPESPDNDNRIVAGYIRQSYTRDEGDKTSPDRQAKNIQSAADRYKLGEVKFFVDAEGHRSGTDTKDRPQWRELEMLILAGQVKVLITNDLSRLHRKQWRIGQLMDWLEKFNVRLILSGLDRDIDFETFGGKLLLLFISMIDEYYAIDIATRVKESIRKRNAAGITVSQPPFGTIRNKEGYLVPTTAGGWLLPDGTYISGKQGEVKPHPDAIWRGYYQCAKRVLELYSQDRIGLYQISYEISQQGWAFRSNTGEPRPFRREDVRRVVASWPAYAGLIHVGKAQERRPGLIPLDWEDTGRAVFSIDLLRKVAQVELKRSVEDRASGSVKHAYPYAFLSLLYCAHCSARSNTQNKPELRRKLTGTDQGKTRRYKHAEGVKCDCKRRSVSMLIIEDQFADILRGLRFHPSIQNIMLTQAQKLTELIVIDVDNFEAQRRIAIKRCKQRLQNTKRAFQDGDIDSNIYKKRKQQIEEELTKLESEVINPSGITADFLSCVKISIGNLAQLWYIATPSSKQLLVRLMFEELVYDLDEQRFVSWTLRSWAKQLLSNDQGHDR